MGVGRIAPMPLYEYLCTECKHSFEFLQRMGEGAEELECPRCGERRLEKQLSTFAAASGATAGGDGNARGSNCGAGSGFT